MIFLIRQDGNKQFPPNLIQARSFNVIINRVERADFIFDKKMKKSFGGIMGFSIIKYDLQGEIRPVCF